MLSNMEYSIILPWKRIVRTEGRVGLIQSNENNYVTIYNYFMGGKAMIIMEYPVIDTKKTGKRISDLRKEKGIKIRELCEYMGFTEPQAIYKWQRGDSLPTVDNLFALSRILGTAIEDILIGDDEMSSPLLGLFQKGEFQLCFLTVPIIKFPNGVKIRRRLLYWRAKY